MLCIHLSTIASDALHHPVLIMVCAKGPVLACADGGKGGAAANNNNNSESFLPLQHYRCLYGLRVRLPFRCKPDQVDAFASPSEPLDLHSALRRLLLCNLLDLSTHEQAEASVLSAFGFLCGRKVTEAERCRVAAC